MHKPLVAVDIVAFGDLRRDLDLQVRLRTSMYRGVAQAFTITGLSLADCHYEDRGDGALIVAPGEVDPCRFLDPFGHHLTAVLRRENRYLDTAHRLRLRAAVHYGHAEHDERGIVGRAPVELFRHLEAPAFKRVMADTPDADLGLIVSGSLFDDASHRGGLIDRDAYRPIRVLVKETRTNAWIWLPPRPPHHPTKP
ncbi:hypothetical protein [Actinomadura sp. 3N508]|uniref:hypothetical protein n=1 Tax=Actinomadura sp. 3N508 TaxID=3375153 RepID=UPI0037A7BC55